jgi:hypothetical protein
MVEERSPANQSVETTGSYLAYLYLLRVPLLVWIFLVAFPLVAVGTGSAAAMFRGIFDLAQPQDGASLFAYFLVTLASCLASMSVAVTARLILLDGHERFGTGRVPRRPGTALLFRLVPLALPPFSIVGSAICEGYRSGAGISPWVEIGGFVAGAAVFVAVAGANRDVREMMEKPNRIRDYLLQLLLRLVTRLIRLSPDGYLDDKGALHGRHVFAIVQFLFSLIFYLGLLYLKWTGNRFGGLSSVPTLCLILVLAMLACWWFSALTFFLDRFRIPLVLPIAAYAFVMSGLPQSDHFYPSSNHEPIHPPSAADILAAHAGAPVILVAASGGGIQAEAWTALVLSGIQQDFQGTRFDFARQLLTMISSVSGGSVGAMLFLAAYRPDGTVPPVGSEDGALERYAPVRQAQTSSLDAVTWGLVYPDLLWSLFPWLKGIELNPLHVLQGSNLTSDRGSAIEEAWDFSNDEGEPAARRAAQGLKTATLASWQAAVREGKLPAVIFNATIVETGARLLLATTALDLDQSRRSTGLRELHDLYPTRDVPVLTAARLSATFPYVSPAARIWDGDVFSHGFHVVDGGYYDNFGVSTLIEWLDAGLDRLSHQAAATMTPPRVPSKIVIVQIRASEETIVERAPRNQGVFFQASAPLQTLMAVRDTAQLSRNKFAMGVIQRPGALALQIPVETQLFDFDGGDREAADPPTAAAPAFATHPGCKHHSTDVPLSWHLTPCEKQALLQEWNSKRLRQRRQYLLQSLRR